MIGFSMVIFLYAVDADTIKVNLPCKEALFCNNMPVRINGIDAPEKDCLPKQWQAGKEMVDSMLKRAKEINLRNCKRDKYFRIDCDVVADGHLVSETLEWTGVVKKYGEKFDCTKK